MPHLPKIAERYLMIRRPRRPTFPQSLEEDYLAALERARTFTIKYGSAHPFGSDAHTKSYALAKAIDEIALELTGDRTHFHLKPPSYQSE